MLDTFPNIIISCKDFINIPHDAVKLIRKNNISVIRNGSNRHWTYEDFKQNINKNTLGIIAGTEPITKKIIDLAPKLKVVCRYGAGSDNVDVNYLKEKNIEFFTTSTHDLAVAEHALMLLLNGLKNTNSKDNKIGRLLYNNEIGIIGLGLVGTQLKDMLELLGANVYIIDKDWKFNYNQKSPEFLLNNCNAICICCDLNPSTYRMINENFLENFKGDLIVNVARAWIVDEDVIVKYLKKGKIKYYTDVINKPELFKDLDNIMITNHIASNTVESRLSMAYECIEYMIGVLRNEFE